MAWGKKEDEGVKPPENKPPEEKPGIDQEALLAKMGELLNPFKESMNSVNSRLAAIEESRKPTQQNSEVPSILDDENGAFNARLGPLALAQVTTNARLTEREVFDDMVIGQWDEYLPEIRKQLGDTPPQIKAQTNYENYVRNVVKMVIGEQALKGGLRRDRKGSRFILEDASGSDNAHSEENAGDKEFLNYEVQTPSGKRVRRGEFLKRMGIDVSTPEGLAAAKKTWSTIQVVN